MTKRRIAKKIPQPQSNVQPKQYKTLPFNGQLVQEKGFSFSFACFDREHELFNLGGPHGETEGSWFISLLDCLKSVSNKNVPELIQSVHDLHPIDWEKTNCSPPENYEQLEYWQFRINKSKGRVIGFRIDNIFYITWIDPYHNLTDSEGYGGVDWYKPGKTDFEKQQERIAELEERNRSLQEENIALNELLFDK